MTILTHPLAILDRLADDSLGDDFPQYPLSKYRDSIFSTIDVETLFSFVKDSHQVFVGAWDNRADALIHQILTAVIAYRGQNGVRLSHLTLSFAFIFDEDIENQKNHPFTFMAKHEQLHAKMAALWPGQNPHPTSTLDAQNLNPVQPQLVTFQAHAQSQVRAVAEQASKIPRLLKELIQANERDSYLSHKELISYLMPYGVTEDQVLAHVSQKVKRQHLENGLGL